VLTSPDSALRLCAARLHYFCDVKKPDYKCLRWDNGLYVYCLSDIACN